MPVQFTEDEVDAAARWLFARLSEGDLSEGNGLQLQSLWRFPAAAVPPWPTAAISLWTIPPAAVPAWLTAATHVDSPCCSCAAMAYSCSPYGESLLQL